MKKQYEDQMAALNQPQQPPVPQQQPPEPQQQPEIDPKQYYEKLADYAKNKVAAIFGNYDELDPIHQAALADEIANVKVQVVTAQQTQRALGNVMGKYSADPEWQQIDRYAWDRLNNMPYAQAVQVRAKLEGMDINFIDQYLNAVRSEYYTNKNQPPAAPVTPVAPVQQAPFPAIPKAGIKPPYVESGGSSHQEEQPAYKVDFTKLGKMTTDQQAEVFRRLGLTNL